MSKHDKIKTSPKKVAELTKVKANGKDDIKEKTKKQSEGKASVENKKVEKKVEVQKKVETPVKKAVSKPAPQKSVNSKKDIVASIKKKPNYILIAGIVIVLIPCIFLGWLLLGSHGNSNEPVEGNRFRNSLDPEIKESEVAELKTSLTLDNVESIDVSLKSATLRININANDDISQEAAQALMNAAYDAAVAKFPIDTYFANKKNSDDSIMKMYDLQVTVYNYIGKTDEEKQGQIQVIRTKNAAAESDVVDIVSTPKNPEVSEELLNPDTSQVPESEGE